MVIITTLTITCKSTTGSITIYYNPSPMRVIITYNLNQIFCPHIKAIFFEVEYFIISLMCQYPTVRGIVEVASYMQVHIRLIHYCMLIVSTPTLYNQVIISAVAYPQ